MENNKSCGAAVCCGAKIHAHEDASTLRALLSIQSLIVAAWTSHSWGSVMCTLSLSALKCIGPFWCQSAYRLKTLEDGTLRLLPAEEPPPPRGVPLGPIAFPPGVIACLSRLSKS